MIIKGIKDGVKSKEIQIRAERIVDVAEQKMVKAKNNTAQMLEALGRQKLEIYSGEIHEFVDIFSKIKNVEFEQVLKVEKYNGIQMDEVCIKEMKTIALTATETLKGVVTGVGTGALIGWGTYGGVMTLGTAGTGAAISGLSGAAATNATLAWLGGGAITAGGGGMVLGSMVLGGIVAIPALLIAGGIIGAKGKESLNNAKCNLAEAKKIDSDVNVAVKELEIIQEKVKQFIDVIEKLQNNVKLANEDIKQLVLDNADWDTYNVKEKERVFAAFKAAQILKTIVDIPLLTEEGFLTEEANNIEQYI